MYPIPPSEHLVENKTCKKCSTSFPITDKDMEFYEKVSPVFPIPLQSEGVSRSDGVVLPEGVSRSDGVVLPEGVSRSDGVVFLKGVPTTGGGVVALKKYLIPPPTLCPDCRQQRRLSFRNERTLYKRKCDATGKEIVSIYSPDKSYTVYHQDYWWSDAWDPMSYGREFDFTRSAMEQMGELMRIVPRPSLFNTNSENSEFTQTCTDNKNTYMLFESSFDEDCLYGYWLHHAYFCVDCSFCDRSHKCYDCLDCME